MTSYNPERGAYDRKAFIFDVRSGKLQSPMDLGRKSGFVSALETDAKNATKSSEADPGDSDQIETHTFHHIAVNYTGFIVYSDFDPVYGDTWVTLPFENYADELKRNTFIRDLMQN